MNPERRPLLMDAEVQGRSARPRPDVRSSPESALVDVKSEDEGTYKHKKNTNLDHTMASEVKNPPYSLTLINIWPTFTTMSLSIVVSI